MGNSGLIKIGDCQASELFVQRLRHGDAAFYWAMHQPGGSSSLLCGYEELSTVPGVDLPRLRDAELVGLERLLSDPAIVLGRNFGENRRFNLAWSVEQECRRMIDHMSPSETEFPRVLRVLDRANSLQEGDWNLQSWSSRNRIVFHYQKLIPRFRDDCIKKSVERLGPIGADMIGDDFHIISDLDDLVGRGLDPEGFYTFTVRDEWLVRGEVAEIDFVEAEWPHLLPGPDREIFRLAFLVACLSPGVGWLHVDHKYSRDEAEVWALSGGDITPVP